MATFILTVKFGIQGMPEDGLGTAFMEITPQTTMRELRDILMNASIEAGEEAGRDFTLNAVKYLNEQLKQ